MRTSVHREDQGTAGDNFGGVTDQQGVARHSRQDEVKLAGQPYRLSLVAVMRGLVFFIDEGVERAPLRWREFPGKCRDHRALETSAHDERVVPLLEGRIGDKGPFVRP